MIITTCDECGLVYDQDTSAYLDCPQCMLKDVRAKNGTEISALKNQVFKLKLQINKGPTPK
jgi:Zn finger protein HypA/HybF involved in hydrogenase expression